MNNPLRPSCRVSERFRETSPTFPGSIECKAIMSPPSSSTTIPIRCRECGVSLSPEVPDGFCPSCMFEGALRLGAVQRPCADPTSPQVVEAQARFGDYDL